MTTPRENTTTSARAKAKRTVSRTARITPRPTRRAGADAGPAYDDERWRDADRRDDAGSPIPDTAARG